MSKLAYAVVVVLVTWSVSAPAARAESFAGEGKVAVGAERMFGLVFASQTTEGAGGESTDSSTTVSVLWNPASNLGASYSTPRLALDYFATSGLSIGAAVGLFSWSSSTTVEAGGTSVESDGPSMLGGLIAPRVGYALTISDAFAIWPRAGITFVTVGADAATGGGEVSGNLLAVTLEGLLVIGFGHDAALLLGPSIDIGVSGSFEATATTPMGMSTTTSTDVKGTDIGVHAGLAVSF